MSPDQIVANLSEKELNFLRNFGDTPVLRKFLKPADIKMCNALIKKDAMVKGHSPDKYSAVQYHIDSSILIRL